MSLTTDLFPAQTAIPEAFAITPLHQRDYLIDGELRPWAGSTHAVYSPIVVSGEEGRERHLIGSYPITTDQEALEALHVAVRAYDHGRGTWPSMSASKRVACLERFVGEMLLQKRTIVNLLMWEIGKSLADATKEFDRTIEYIYDTVGAFKDLDRNSSRFVVEQGIIGQIRRSPLGVVLCMGPFNYPLNETYTTLIPALLMGNVILFKPPKFGTLLHYPMLAAFGRCFPPGVVNTIYGRGHAVVPALMQSGRIDALTLIGSSRVADSLKKMHPKSNRLRAILGLDAKNAGIVLPSADLDLAVRECLLGALSFNGQRCTAIKMIFVHRSLVDAFLERFCAGADALPMGMPWDEGVQITPLPEPHKPMYLADLIADAESLGAAVVNDRGGRIVDSLVSPTVLYPVYKAMKIYREEQFGPVVPVAVFDHPDEPLQYVIDSDHGQQVSLFGEDSQEVARMLDVLVNQVSRVNLNAQCQRGPDSFPFTGRKDSAEGVLSVVNALHSFSIRTVVATKNTERNRELVNTIVTNHESGFLSTQFIF